MRWALLIVISGCIDTNSVVCSDGQVCPSNTVCTPLTHIANDPNAELCASPDAIAACNGKQESDLCDGGACHDGVCQPIVCGNGYTDPGEACDDRNNASGDGCSADCLSTEVCGNGVRDGAKFEECDDGNLVDGDGCDSRCITELPVWKSLAMNMITARTKTAMAFDLARGQLVLFGGVDSATGTVANDTWLWNGAGWVKATPHTSPPARAQHAMTYDPVHHVIVMFGGNNGSIKHFGDTWIWDGHDWHIAFPNTQPGGRDGAAMTYDGKRQRVLLFGGHTKSIDLMDIYYNGLWAYDGTDWSQVDKNSAMMPEPRTQAALGYDPLRDALVLNGGQALAGPSTATWIFDGTSWHSSTTGTQPPLRYGAGVQWDAVTHTLMMFGGFTSADTNDVWQWNGTSWLQSAPAVRPAARDSLGLAADPARGRLLLFGGNADAKTWQWNGVAWSDITPAAIFPSSVEQSAFDVRRSRAIITLAGGETDSSDGYSWTVLPQVLLPPSSSLPAMTYDLAHDQTIAYGGSDPMTGSATSPTWLGSPTAWTLATPPTLPPGRNDMRIAYDAARGRTLVFGGSNGAAMPLGDTWTWDGATWEQQSPAHVPPPRKEQMVAYDWVRKQVVMVGGMSTGFLADMWTWDGTDWTDVTQSSQPTARADATFVYAPRRRSIILFSNPSAQTNDTWEWNGMTWTLLDAGLSPAARVDALAFPSKDGALFLTGGRALGVLGFPDSWQLVWENTSQPETCVVPLDLDGDGLAGCDDPDCYFVCNPTCLPGTACDVTQPHCGDGTCDPLETCRMCPGDCGACPAICGDSFCDPGESAANCPGDCH